MCCLGCLCVVLAVYVLSWLSMCCLGCLCAVLVVYVLYWLSMCCIGCLCVVFGTFSFGVAPAFCENTGWWTCQLITSPIIVVVVLCVTGWRSVDV